MSYFEVETDIAARCFIRARNIEECIMKLRDNNIEEENIMQISRCHYNLVLV